MQNRSTVGTLFEMRSKKDSLFSKVPPELFPEINRYIDSQDYEIALQLIADGKLMELNNLLKAKPHLVLFNGGTAITPAGKTLADPDISLLECALGAGDFEIAELIFPLFSQFEGGETKRDEQLARYRSILEAALDQKPDDLTWLMQIINNSSSTDVSEELKTGAEYDPEYKSALRDALNKWRESKLAPESRIITSPRMHFNHKNLIHAFKLLSAERQLGRKDIACLIWRQIIGFIELVELPAFERHLFASGKVQNLFLILSTHGRSFNYKYCRGCFPAFDEKSILNHSGLGFDLGVSPLGEAINEPKFYFNIKFLKKCLEEKFNYLIELVQPKSKNQYSFR